jgi:hypothetical protein
MSRFILPAILLSLWAPPRGGPELPVVGKDMRRRERVRRG